MRRRADCRLCGSKELELVFALTPTPPANAFVPAEKRDTPQQRFPLDLFFCRECTHLQLLDVVDPALLFEDYVYVSGTSPVFVNHFKGYAEDMIHRFGLKAPDLVIDIGSNDGTLLRFFKDKGLQVLGIDPAKKIAEQATKAGVKTMAEFFTPELAERLRRKEGPAQLICANNVFAHADDLKGMVAGIRHLLAPDGVFVFEVSYLADVINKTLFDTIYHEHLAYHAVKPLQRFFRDNGMELIEALRVDSHGGSLRGMAQRTGAKRDVGASVAELLALEEKLGLHKAETYRRFDRQIDERRRELVAVLKSLKAEGKRIAGFGAPAKATTLMHHFGLGPEYLDFVVDDSPLKQGLFTPGHHIPVLSSKALEERRPDALLILAWNFAPSIIEKNKAFAQRGGRFIIPLPKVEYR
ncbi:MAG: class I SAM-dependent methyltransferase [Elusimicrobia bacterium]|nr:class I SAM-dependent methyltransferase [Elusimicrobiota bacterium]